MVNELTDLQERIEKLAEILEQTLDLDAILRLAEDASALSWEPLQQFLPETYTTKSTLENNEIPQIRIGVARDEAFCFYYEDNLDQKSGSSYDRRGIHRMADGNRKSRGRRTGFHL